MISKRGYVGIVGSFYGSDTQNLSRILNCTYTFLPPSSPSKIRSRTRRSFFFFKPFLSDFLLLLLWKQTRFRMFGLTLSFVSSRITAIYKKISPPWKKRQYVTRWIYIRFHQCRKRMLVGTSTDPSLLLKPTSPGFDDVYFCHRKKNPNKYGCKLRRIVLIGSTQSNIIFIIRVITLRNW